MSKNNSKIKISVSFRIRLSEKLMDLGNYTAVGLVLGQFATGTEFSVSLLLLGISSAIILFIAGYIISP